MTKWIRFVDESIFNDSSVVLNLDSIIAFVHDGKKREIYMSASTANYFHVSQKKNPSAYQQILDYVKQTAGHDLT